MLWSFLSAEATARSGGFLPPSEQDITDSMGSVHYYNEIFSGSLTPYLAEMPFQ